MRNATNNHLEEKMDNNDVIFVFEDSAAINKDEPFFARFRDSNGVSQDMRLSSPRRCSGQSIISEVVSLLGVDRKRVQVSTFTKGMMYDDHKCGTRRRPLR